MREPGWRVPPAAVHRHRHGRRRMARGELYDTSAITRPPSPPASPSTSPTSRSCWTSWPVRQRTYMLTAARRRNCPRDARRCRRHPTEIVMRASNRFSSRPASSSSLPPCFRANQVPSAGDLKVETVADGLVHPWALQFLSNGRMLITERPGRIRIPPDGKLSLAVEERAAGCRRRSGWPATIPSHSTAISRNQPHDLFLLQLMSAAAMPRWRRATCQRRRSATRRRGDHLPSGRKDRARQQQSSAVRIAQAPDG